MLRMQKVNDDLVEFGVCPFGVLRTLYVDVDTMQNTGNRGGCSTDQTGTSLVRFCTRAEKGS